MGGKTNTSTATQTVPPQVLAQYANVNDKANQTAQTPFQSYSQDPNSFVAPLTDTQNAGIAATNAAAGQAQPYYGAATGALLGAQNATTPYYGAAGQSLNAAGQTIGGIGSTLNAAQPYNAGATGLAIAGSQAVDPSQLNASAINQYISPYLNTVLGSESALLNQNNQQQQAGQLGNAITSGAFGGDRAGIAAANLEQQQNLGNANIYSGILNNAYSQALSTAQQQQGVGLSAAQANRAALQTASGQIQGIGQQQYEQGLGAEQAQYGQETGLSAAQQGLGQTVYNTGANTSTALAGLGAGAQSAALQGAQAQLAAGQQQQQTQQAGLTALYNQFLMQQSYPFQVDQFLANIAEGTGSLSGSTTTTTQPGSLFSDKRLKDHVEKVGETFDGQPIYRFRYKGDDTTHMGLMAQDVEKHHPKAVGLAHGYKTVNYEDATEGAVDRGHFRKGGLVAGFAGGGSTGFDPQLESQLLQNAQGMYGPYLSAMQGGTSASGGGPYGGMAHIPSANVPVSGLRAPQINLAAQKSPVAQAKDFADATTGLYSDAKKGLGWVQSHGNDNSTPDSASSLASDLQNTPDDDVSSLGLYRGGRARGYASGGMPYQGGLALDIPDDPSTYQLPAQPSAPKQNSTLDDLGDIAKIATMLIPKARGGLVARKGYDDGGSPTDDSGWGDLGGLAQIIGNTVSHPISALQKAGLADASQSGIDYGSEGQSAPSLVDPTSAKTPAEYKVAILHNAAQTAKTPEEYGAILKAASPGPHDSMAASPNGSSSRRSGLSGGNADPWANGPPTDIGGPTGLVPQTPEAQGPDIGAPPPANLALQTNAPEPGPMGLASAPPTSSSSPSLGDQIGQAASGLASKVAPKGGYIDRLMHGDEMTLVPFLTGLAAATGAPTQNTFTALAQGLGAGAQSYKSLQTQQAELAQKQAQAQETQARVGQVGAQTALTRAQAYQVLQAKAPSGMQAVMGNDPNGHSFTGPDGNPWHYVLQTNLTDYGTNPAGKAMQSASNGVATGIAPSSDTDAFMAQNYGVDPTQPGVANHTRLLATNPALGATEDAAEKSAQTRIGSLQEADSTHRQLLQSAESLSQLSHGTLTGQGYDSAYRSQLANMYNTITGMMGIPPDATVNSDLTAHQITEKIRQLSGAQIAHQYGERAASIAHSISDVLPSGDLTPDAAGHILSQMLVANQQQRDFSQYHNAYVGRYGTPINVEQSFQKDQGPTYDKDQRALSTVLSSPVMPSLMNALSSPDQQKRAAAQAIVDKKYGSGFHRYFTGGQ